jgi:TolA-binding protein
MVDRAPARASVDAGVGLGVPHVEASALPARPASAGPGAAAGGAAGGGGGGGAGGAAATGTEATGGETTGGLQAAGQAIKKGDWNRARQIYEGLVARNPGDSEALAGIGDVDRAQGNSAGAISAYKRALAVNPSYLPALLGVADTQWATGDRANATRGYKEIEDRFPEGTYPAYVKSRTESGASSAPAGAASTGAPGDRNGL